MTDDRHRAVELAEQATLGAALTSIDAVAIVAAQLRSEDFASTPHREIMAAIIALSARSATIDIITVPAELQARGTLERVPDAYSYVAALPNACATPEAVDDYVAIVLRHSRLRAMEHNGLRLAEQAQQPGADPDALLDQLRDTTAELAARGTEELPGGTMSALLDQPDEEPEMLPLLGQRRHLRRDWVYMVVSPPKYGKTGLLTSGSAELLAAGHSVLYFTEEGASVWRARTHMLRGWGDVPWNRFDLRHALGVDPARLVAYAAAHPAEIVVVDAIRYLLQLKDENDNSEIARKLAPWYRLGHGGGKTVILAHHARKAPGQYGEAVAGGYGLIGAVDGFFEISRVNAKQPSRRVITGLGRVFEVPDLMYEQRPDGRMWGVGDPAAVELGGVRGRILALLVDDPARRWKTVEVVNALMDPKPGEEQVRLALVDLAKTGRITRTPPITENAERRTVTWGAVPTTPAGEESACPTGVPLRDPPVGRADLHIPPSGANLSAHDPVPRGQADLHNSNGEIRASLETDRPSILIGLQRAHRAGFPRLDLRPGETIGEGEIAWTAFFRKARAVDYNLAMELLRQQLGDQPEERH